jgi:hypothetical protein
MTFWVAGAALGGVLISSNAASDASDQLVQSGRDSNALVNSQYQQTRADNAGVRRRGDWAGNRLAYLMGDNSQNTPEALRKELLSQYTTRGTPQLQPSSGFASYGENDGAGNTLGSLYSDASVNGQSADVIDEVGLKAAIDKRMQEQQGQGSDPNFGSLSRNFGMSDFVKDPGYQFRMDEGNRSIENSGAARGMQLSGATLKALSRFGSDYGSKEYGTAYDRFNNNNTQQYNRLAGIAGSGMTATNNVNQLGQASAFNQGSTLQGIGNAQAGGTIGTANAYTNGLSQVMQQIRNPGASPSVYDGGYSIGQGSAYGGNRAGL